MDFEGVKQASEDGSTTIVDVRNRNELEEVGKIPTSINIPLPELEEALQLDNAEFESKYGFPKPPLDKPLVTHCMKGARAAKAQDILVAQGYQNVKCYAGSFTDWVAQEGPIEKL